MPKLSLLFLVMALSLGLSAQTGLLETTVTMEGGRHSSEEVIDKLNAAGVVVSYSSGSLKSPAVQLSAKAYSAKDLLNLLFDTSKYRILEKEGRILVVKLEKGNITISGYVEDASSHERLIGADVFLPDLQVGTTTNKFGFYSLTFNPSTDSLSLAASFVGYAQQLFKLSAQRDHKLDIRINTKSQELSEVTVTDDDLRAHNPQMSQIRLSAKEIEGIPAFFGEEDVLKSIQMLPGVQRGSEGNINYIVRGGGPDQNLILLDGVPVYNAGHVFGYLSVFNTDAVKNIQFTKGGFPARYGGRLSSVLEIDMKEGDLEEYHGAGSLGLLSAKLTLEGPIVKNKASFMISGRRTYFDLFYRPFLQDNDVGYFFHDINAKVNYKFSRKDRLYLSFYTGKDKVFSHIASGDNEFDDNMDYGNMTGSVRYNHLFSEKLFSNLTATYTKFNLSLNSQTRTPFQLNGFEYFSKIEDYGLKYDLDYSLNSNHYIRGGAAYTYHIFRPGAIQYDEQDSKQTIDSLLTISPFNYSHDFYAYLEDDWKISERWRVNAGLHYSAYFVENSFFNSLQPRITGRFLLQRDWSVKASYSFMQQYVHLLTNSGVGLPTDLWVSSTDDVPPQQSQQVALGTTKGLWNDKFEFTTELYYKYMKNLIAFKEGTLFSTSANWQNQVTTGGTGDAYGWEVMLKKKSGKTTGWLSYTLAKTTRQFDEINDGEAFPYKYDRRHDVKFIMTHKFNERFHIGLAFLYNTGLRATIPTGTFMSITGGQEILFSDRNAYQYPDYHRLDLSFNWTKKKKWGQRTWTIGLYNAYNRQNPYYIYFQANSSTRQAYQLSLFPIMPSFSYTFQF